MPSTSAPLLAAGVGDDMLFRMHPALDAVARMAKAGPGPGSLADSLSFRPSRNAMHIVTLTVQVILMSTISAGVSQGEQSTERLCA